MNSRIHQLKLSEIVNKRKFITKNYKKIAKHCFLLRLRTITCNEVKNVGQNKELEAFGIYFIWCAMRQPLMCTRDSYVER